VFAGKTFWNAAIAGGALAALGAEQKNSAIAATNTTRQTARGSIGRRRDQVGYGCRNVTTGKQLLSASI
jgi:hypothetical protein